MNDEKQKLEEQIRKLVNENEEVRRRETECEEKYQSIKEENGKCLFQDIS